MWIPTASRKGEDNHCWIKASHCLSTLSELPMRPSYWLFRVAATSLHISCINVIGCAVWFENTCLHRCFHKIQRVLGRTNSNTTWDLALIGVEWTLLMVEKKNLLCFYNQSHPLLLMLISINWGLLISFTLLLGSIYMFIVWMLFMHFQNQWHFKCHGFTWLRAKKHVVYKWVKSLPFMHFYYRYSSSLEGARKD